MNSTDSNPTNPNLTQSHSKPTIPTIAQLTKQGVAEIFPDGKPDGKTDNLADFIAQADRPLRIKLGIDPTRPDLHLGHAVVLRKMRQFQDAGHVAVLIIGDFTALIGDPTGKSEARPRLTAAEVKTNAQTYFDQAKQILDFDTRLEVHYNSQWLSNLDLQQIIGLLSSMTVGQMLAKEDFGDRYGKGTPIYLHEFLYPLMQGYDSVQINSDVEIGGTDQRFNILVGRDLQTRFSEFDKSTSGSESETSPKTSQTARQFGMVLPLLVGLDGSQKMSKSADNYVGIAEPPLSMYSKLEKVPDSAIDEYFKLLTDLELSALPDNPREKQKLLALTITAQFHGEAVAKQAQTDAEKIVLAGSTDNLGDLPEFDLSQINFPAPLYYLVKASGLCKSNKEAQSQIKNGAVRLDGEKLAEGISFEDANDLRGKVLQVGKKKFLRLI
ncbi:tyrosyl-tRNA synthetase [Thalassoporum mexicanum PCC 7367]|nr:tyrosyl-tRNA synthetase [Pseudanabaena sp. PCC 7367]